MTGFIGELVWVLTASHHRAMYFMVGWIKYILQKSVLGQWIVKEALIFRAFKLSVNSQ